MSKLIANMRRKEILLTSTLFFVLSGQDGNLEYKNFENESLPPFPPPHMFMGYATDTPTPSNLMFIGTTLLKIPLFRFPQSSFLQSRFPQSTFTQSWFCSRGSLSQGYLSRWSCSQGSSNCVSAVLVVKVLEVEALEVEVPSVEFVMVKITCYTGGPIRYSRFCYLRFWLFTSNLSGT